MKRLIRWLKNRIKAFEQWIDKLESEHLYGGW